MSAELTITGPAQREAWLRRVGAPPDPLGDYLDSLARTRDLDVDEVLPAHEWRFAGLPGGSTPSWPTTSGGWPNCSPRSASAPAPPPGSWPGT